MLLDGSEFEESSPLLEQTEEFKDIEQDSLDFSI